MLKHHTIKRGDFIKVITKARYSEGSIGIVTNKRYINLSKRYTMITVDIIKGPYWRKGDTMDYDISDVKYLTKTKALLELI
jgi:signal peptidase I